MVERCSSAAPDFCKSWNSCEHRCKLAKSDSCLSLLSFIWDVKSPYILINCSPTIASVSNAPSCAKAVKNWLVILPSLLRNSDSITSRSALIVSACSHNFVSSWTTGLPARTLEMEPEGTASFNCSSVLDISISDCLCVSIFCRTVSSALIAFPKIASYLFNSVHSVFVSSALGLRVQRAPKRLRIS